MYRKFALAGAVLAAAVSLTSTGFAGANDYAFEPVKAEVKKGNGVTLTVRLVHQPTGKPVSDVVIFSPRIDMSPEGMETMTASSTPVAGTGFGEPRDCKPKSALLRPRPAAETARPTLEPAKMPANCGLFGRDQKTPVRIGLHGGGCSPHRTGLHGAIPVYQGKEPGIL